MIDAPTHRRVGPHHVGDHRQRPSVWPAAGSGTRRHHPEGVTRSHRNLLILGRVFGRGENVTPEIEALLCGTYVEYLERRGRHVPPWAWINLLAHGSEEALCSAARARRRFLDVNPWRHARGYLAGEVLDAAHRTGSLRTFQATVLVPLELRHLATPPPRRTGPGQWAAGVLTAIEEHHRAPRRPQV